MSRNSKPIGHPHRQEGDPFVIPPVYHSQSAGHHWLLVRDMDGHTFGHVVLQWQPGSRRWCRSGDVATGRDVDVEYYQYVAPCPMPPKEEDLKQLKRTLTGLDSEADRARLAEQPMYVGEACWKFLRKIIEPMLP